jgi:hypothetical protein
MVVSVVVWESEKAAVAHSKRSLRGDVDAANDGKINAPESADALR